MKKKPRVPNAVHGRNYVYSLHVHLVWVTKYREPLLTTPGLVDEMKRILAHFAKLAEVELKSVEVMPDHVHLLVGMRPMQSVTDVMKALKGGSARAFLQAHPEIKRDKFWGGHIWSHSYYAGSVGYVDYATVKQYVENQHSK